MTGSRETIGAFSQAILSLIMKLTIEHEMFASATDSVDKRKDA